MEENKKKNKLSAESQMLNYWLERYKDTRNEKDRASVIDCLKSAPVFLPVTPIQSDNLPLGPNGEKQIQFRMAILQTPEGVFLLPVFADPDQIPAEERKKHPGGFLRVPISHVIQTLQRDANIQGIVVDPYTNKFPMNREEVLALEEQKEA